MIQEHGNSLKRVDIMKNKLVAFDYDGVIADTLQANIRLINKIFEIMNFNKKIEESHFHKATEVSFKAIVDTVGFPMDKFDEFYSIVQDIGKSIIDETTLFDGVKELLDELSKECHLVIVSNNNAQNIVIPGAKKNGIDTYFEAITGADFGLNKVERINKYCNDFSIDKENAYMIGDGINDITAGNEAGVNSIAVCWGYQGIDILQQYNPTFIAKTVRDIRKIIV